MKNDSPFHRVLNASQPQSRREFLWRSGGGSVADKVRRGHLEALGRAPERGDEKVLVEYAREHGLTNYCRLLLNLNEFSFVD